MAIPTAVYVSPLPTQSTDGSRVVDLKVEVDDGDDDSLKLKVEYSSSTGGPWTACTLTGTPVVGYGSTPDLNNGNPYQIGTSTPIDTSSGANTCATQWDVDTDLPGAVGWHYLQVTVNDGTSDGTPVVSIAIESDTVDPINTTLTLVDDPPQALATTTHIQVAWTETNPDTNEAGVRISATTWSDTSGTSGTAALQIISVAHPTIYGDDYIQIRATETDDYGNTDTSSDGYLEHYVVPAQPYAVTVDNVTDTSFDVTPVDHPTDAAGITGYFDHAVYISGPGASGYLQADGTLSETSVVWDTATNWTGKTVTPLPTQTRFSIKSKVRNLNYTSVESDWSDPVYVTTGYDAPSIDSIRVTPSTSSPGHWYFKVKLSDADSSNISVAWEYITGTDWQAAGMLTGDFGNLEIEPSPAINTVSALWNAADELGEVVFPTAQVRIWVHDGQNSVSAVSNVFILDTTPPEYLGAEISAVPAITTCVVTWTQYYSDDYFSTYEIYLSATNYKEALARGGTLWSQYDDTALTTYSTKTTTVTGLTQDTTYYCVLYAKDQFGNYSSPLQFSFTTGFAHSITGVTKDENGYSVPGCTVRAYYIDTLALADSTTSNSLGQYTLGVNDPGPYYVVVWKDPWYRPYAIDNVWAVET